VTADFSTIRFAEIGPDRVRVSGARGAERPMNLKVSTGLDVGFVAEGQISYAGIGALARARLARQIIESRLRWIARGDLRMDFIGIDSIHGAALSETACEPYEVRLRAAGRFFDENDARRLMHEVESLYVNGPAGGGGVVTSMRENIAMDAAFLPRDLVVPTIGFEVA
jgi:Acyclic terpene utilisation family protein AtuA